MKWIDGKFTDGYCSIYSGTDLCMNFQSMEQNNNPIANNLHQRALSSRAKDHEEKFPAPKGLEYLPYQNAGIAYMTKVKKCLLADDQGLGKTIQTCGLINNVKPKKILIICPSSLKQNWANELRKWIISTRHISIIEGRKNEFNEKDPELSHQITIINYDIVHYNKKGLSQDWDLIAIDEAHYLKNPDAKRTQAVLEICERSERVVAMSGTPMSNRPIELWPMLNGLFRKYLPKDFRTMEKYGKFFCAGFLENIRRFDNKLKCVTNRKVWNYRGASNLNILNSILRERFMIRRLKKDVLTQLPDKTISVVDLSTTAQVRRILKGEDGYRDEVIRAIETGKRMPPLEGMSSARKELAMEKVKPSVEFIKDILDNDEKVIVFAHHKDVVDALESELRPYWPQVVTGGTPNEFRQPRVDAFQDRDEVRVFIGNIQAAGVGITLTAATNVVFVESSWVPGENVQCEDRAHRIGQENAVNVYYLCWYGSMDAQILKTSLRKQRNIDVVMK